jgi:hypothetical protein
MNSRGTLKIIKKIALLFEIFNYSIDKIEYCDRIFLEMLIMIKYLKTEGEFKSMFTSYNDLPNIEAKIMRENIRFGWIYAEADRQSREEKRQWVSKILVQCAGILIQAGTSLKARAERLMVSNAHSIPSFQGR